MEEQTRLQKIVFRALLIMILVFGVLMLVSRLQKGVEFDNTLLKVRTTESSTVYTGMRSGLPLTITVNRPAENTTQVEYVLGADTREIYTMEYPLAQIQTEHGDMVPGIRVLKGGEVLFEGGYDPDQQMGMGWYDENGEWDVGIEFHYSGEPAAQAALNERNVAYFAQGPELTVRGSWIGYLLLMFLTLLLMLDVHCPEFFFNLRYSWHVENPEPTALYCAVQQVGWVIYPFLLLIGFIWILREIQ